MTATSADLARRDLHHCRAAIRTGSHSFHAASRLLPRRVADPAMVLYAFCRLADDAVDDVAPDRRAGAVLALHDRLERVYAGRPADVPADRAFARVVEAHAMPRALPEALLEGFAWDAQGRRHADLSDLRAYAARVASAVGAMMCVLMGVRCADALARACDLGVAMQLTNVARDVGEDARAGRLYLPTEWLADPDAFVARPTAAEAAPHVRRLLAEARRLYGRAGSGVRALPPAARPGILAARHVYGAIGDAVARAGHDSVTRRATTTPARKLALMGLAGAQAAATSLLPRSPVLHAAPLDECRFLVDAAAAPDRPGWSAPVLDVLSQLAARDRAGALPAE